MDRETLKQDAQEGTDIEQIKKLLNCASKHYRCGTAADPRGATQGALLFRVGQGEVIAADADFKRIRK